MIRPTIAALALAAAAAGFVPGSSYAGGYVRIQSVSDLPREIQSGRTVAVAFTLERPGFGLVTDAKPVVRMRNGRHEIEARAHQTKTPGTYVANVRVPSSGSWSVVVDSRMCGNTCTLEPILALGPNAKKERVAKR